MTAIAATTAVAPLSKDADKIREQFSGLLKKADKRNPRESDVQALKDLLDKHKDLQLWRIVSGMGELAENQVLDALTNEGAGHGARACWEQRLESIRADLGYATSPPLERLLIQQVSLCWVNLNLVEYRHVNIMKQSITLTVGAYWDKRLSLAQQRFTRACECLARVRRLSRRIPIQVNIAANGGQQINVASEG